MQNIAIIDYGMGNIGSIVKKLSRTGCLVTIVSKKQELFSVDKLILPGVGHFAPAVHQLKETGLWEALTDVVMHKKIPVFGICLGMQLMARESEEGNSAGLGWFDARVVRFRVTDPCRFKVPHTGWNQVVLQKESPLFTGVDLTPGFYFTHAYHLRCNQPEDILSMTAYESPFVSAIQQDHLFGVQFHPEKSHEAGERMLVNFVNL